MGRTAHRLTRLARRLLRDNRAAVRAYFELIHRRADPWDVAETGFEIEKREHIMAALGGRRFRRALEIGGGQGFLASSLATITEKLLLTDISTAALRHAGRRLADHPNVTTTRLDVVGDAIPGTFDLIVCQEVLVYAPVEKLAAVRDKLVAALADGGTLLLLNPRSIHDDDAGLEYKDIGARTVHDIFMKTADARVEADEVRDTYRLTIWRKEAELLTG